MSQKLYLISLIEKMYIKNKLAGFTVALFDYDKHSMKCTLERKYIPKLYMYNMINSQQIIPINFTHSGNRLTELKFNNTKELVDNTAKAVRRYMETVHGTGTNLAGYCIEASAYIVAILKYLGIKNVTTVEGWCLYDDEDYGSDVPYDAHTWVELNNGKVYIDVTADQFNAGMDKENEFTPIIIRSGLPHGIRYDEPEEEVDYWA